jgi:NAD-dependent DNA ligase
MFTRFAAIAATAILLSACSPGEAVVDTSSTTAFQASLANMREGMDASRAEKFQGAIMAIAMKDIGDAMQSGGLAGLATAVSLNSDPEALLSRIGPLISGKNAEEVLQVAQDVVAEREARQLAAIGSEIAALETELAAIEQEQAANRGVLQSLSVSGARFRMNDSGYLRQPAIDLTLANNTGKPIKRIFFRGILETPGRSVPWVDEEFNYEVPGGIENGESLPLSLAPNMFSEWGDGAHTERTDTVLTVEVVDIEFADETRLQSVSSGELQSKRDRLDQLLQQQSNLVPGV